MARDDAYPQSSGGSPLFTRRGIIRGAAVVTGAAVASTALASCASADSGTAVGPTLTVDVVIVGGGLAGLSAARDLNAAGKSIVVLEANNRVGGRTWTEPVPGGAWVDMGGQWIGPTQDRVLALAESLGLKTFPFFKTGNLQLIFDNQKLLLAPDSIGFSAKGKRTGTPIPNNVSQEFLAAFGKVDALAKTVPAAAPWTAPNADVLDSTSVASFMADNFTVPMAAFVFKEAVWGWFASEPKDISLLHLLTYISAAGGIIPLETHGIGLRIEGGTQQMSTLLAEKLGNDKVLLDTPVRKIDQSGDGVAVSTDNGTFTGKQVIVAIPPSTRMSRPKMELPGWRICGPITATSKTFGLPTNRRKCAHESRFGRFNRHPRRGGRDHGCAR